MSVASASISLSATTAIGGGAAAASSSAGPRVDGAEWALPEATPSRNGAIAFIAKTKALLQTADISLTDDVPTMWGSGAGGHSTSPPSSTHSVSGIGGVCDCSLPRLRTLRASGNHFGASGGVLLAAFVSHAVGASAAASGCEPTATEAKTGASPTVVSAYSSLLAQSAAYANPSIAVERGVGKASLSPCGHEGHTAFSIDVSRTGLSGAAADAAAALVSALPTTVHAVMGIIGIGLPPSNGLSLTMDLSHNLMTDAPLSRLRAAFGVSPLAPMKHECSDKAHTPPAVAKCCGLLNARCFVEGNPLVASRGLRPSAHTNSSNNGSNGNAKRCLSNADANTTDRIEWRELTSLPTVRADPSSVASRGASAMPPPSTADAAFRRRSEMGGGPLTAAAPYPSHSSLSPQRAPSAFPLPRSVSAESQRVGVGVGGSLGPSPLRCAVPSLSPLGIALSSPSPSPARCAGSTSAAHHQGRSPTYASGPLRGGGGGVGGRRALGSLSPNALSLQMNPREGSGAHVGMGVDIGATNDEWLCGASGNGYSGHMYSGNGRLSICSVNGDVSAAAPLIGLGARRQRAGSASSPWHSCASSPMGAARNYAARACDDVGNGEEAKTAMRRHSNAPFGGTFTNMSNAYSHADGTSVCEGSEEATAASVSASFFGYFPRTRHGPDRTSLSHSAVSTAGGVDADGTCPDSAAFGSTRTLGSLPYASVSPSPRTRRLSSRGGGLHGGGSAANASVTPMTGGISPFRTPLPLPLAGALPAPPRGASIGGHHATAIPPRSGSTDASLIPMHNVCVGSPALWPYMDMHTHSHPNEQTSNGPAHPTGCAASIGSNANQQGWPSPSHPPSPSPSLPYASPSMFDAAGASTADGGGGGLAALLAEAQLEMDRIVPPVGEGVGGAEVGATGQSSSPSPSHRQFSSGRMCAPDTARTYCTVSQLSSAAVDEADVEAVVGPILDMASPYRTHVTTSAAQAHTLSNGPQSLLT